MCVVCRTFFHAIPNLASRSIPIVVNRTKRLDTDLRAYFNGDVDALFVPYAFEQIRDFFVLFTAGEGILRVGCSGTNTGKRYVFRRIFVTKTFSSFSDGRVNWTSGFFFFDEILTFSHRERYGRGGF